MWTQRGFQAGVIECILDTLFTSFTSLTFFMPGIFKENKYSQISNIKFENFLNIFIPDNVSFQEIPNANKNNTDIILII